VHLVKNKGYHSVNARGQVCWSEYSGTNWSTVREVAGRISSHISHWSRIFSFLNQIFEINVNFNQLVIFYYRPHIASFLYAFGIQRRRRTRYFMCIIILFTNAFVYIL
jgi:hypothetical protein